MSQTDRVYALLDDNPQGVCARTFIYNVTPGIPRIAARILDLRDMGFDVVSERCNKTHRNSQIHIMYRLRKDGR